MQVQVQVQSRMERRKICDGRKLLDTHVATRRKECNSEFMQVEVGQAEKEGAEAESWMRCSYLFASSAESFDHGSG